MKYLVVSDTHGSLINFMDMIRKEGNYDGLIHLGDVEGQDHEIERIIGNRAYIQIRGNCDLDYTLPDSRVAFFGTHRVLMLHGHKEQVKLSDRGMLKRAKEEQCDIVFYGHSHKADITTVGRVTLANPGSLSEPRGFDVRPSYIVMEVDKDDNLHMEIRYLSER